jgi:hypothetical protein
VPSQPTQAKPKQPPTEAKAAEFVALTETKSNSQPKSEEQEFEELMRESEKTEKKREKATPKTATQQQPQAKPKPATTASNEFSVSDLNSSAHLMSEDAEFEELLRESERAERIDNSELKALEDAPIEEEEDLPELDTERYQGFFVCAHVLCLLSSLDWVVSERVLQHRLTQLKQQAASSKGAELNLSLNAQILSVETRINAIIGLIQQGPFSNASVFCFCFLLFFIIIIIRRLLLGELTVEKYAHNLNTRIKDEKEYAAYWAKRDNKKYSAGCLLRMKLMQEELEG